MYFAFLVCFYLFVSRVWLSSTLASRQIDSILCFGLSCLSDISLWGIMSCSVQQSHSNTHKAHTDSPLTCQTAINCLLGLFFYVMADITASEGVSEPHLSLLLLHSLHYFSKNKCALWYFSINIAVNFGFNRVQYIIKRRCVIDSEHKCQIS